MVINVHFSACSRPCFCAPVKGNLIINKKENQAKARTRKTVACEFIKNSNPHKCKIEFSFSFTSCEIQSSKYVLCSSYYVQRCATLIGGIISNLVVKFCGHPDVSYLLGGMRRWRCNFPFAAFPPLEYSSTRLSAVRD